MPRSVPASVVVVMAAVGLGACVPPQEDPTTVQDLRVLGISIDPPEILIPGCNPSLLVGLASALDGGTVTVDPQLLLQVLPAVITPVRVTALIADPKGNGRDLDYRLLACASTTDRDCNNEGDYVELANGKTPAGEPSWVVVPGVQFLDGGASDAGTPLVLEVLSQDRFFGLGGIRVPMVLDVSAPDTGERIFAQKLMVYTCQFFPSQRQNVQPRLPGLIWNGEPWTADQLRVATGGDTVVVEPVDFSSAEEAYVVPSVMVTPVALQEAWKVNWLTTFGTFSAYTTGGSDFSGTVGRHRVTWSPDPSATTARDFTVHAVVRDGRGGQSWTTRTASWRP